MRGGILMDGVTSKNIDASIGRRLRELRIAAKQDAEKVAYAAKMTLADYEAGERGERRFNAVELYDIAKRLGVTFEDIVSAL
jgi:transcriptional regulator with XRE-family HTH domain